ncbi:MAG: hypothetical protein KAV48_01440 [Methanomicrobia archaeon]|nr:hypothetical protein [Methanomicrobia archaeon]MCK4432572.1 hypothetical protein [Methanomicrobia archaeon]MCK4636690.1 hypothetical protein [Methanomicrobia archaeon]
MKNTEILLKFARELKDLVDDFSEEIEILANEDLMDQIKENEEEKKKGNIKTFDNIEELKKELKL